MIKKNQPAELSAFEAISEAQKIAFSPIAFQAVVSLLRLGLLKKVSEAGSDGATAGQLAKSLDISEYGVKVLLDMGLSMNLVWPKDDRYVLDKVGHYLLEDRMSQINLNFVQDVCYEAMIHLMKSIETESPDGLKIFGDWSTLYPGLSSLPSPARESWIDFNNFYSERAFRDAMPIAFESRPGHMLDIGGNTGVWAHKCINYDPDVRVTIVDLPEQTAVARENIRSNGAQDRIDTYDADLLDPQQVLPSGADTIWMSQFIDCFSEAQIAEILRKVTTIMDKETSLYILDLFWDRQQHEAATYSVNATSLYFSCIANGCSRMYHSADIIGIAKDSGLAVKAQHDDLGLGHTLLHCMLE